MIKNKFLKLGLYGIIGGLIGFSYYYFIGCTSGGGCPLTSTWYITTGYGLLAGIVMAIPQNKNEEDQITKAS